MVTKRKAVISADVDDLERIEELVRARRFKTVSEFVRQAMQEKLARFAEARLAEEVARYCAEGRAAEDADLVDAQALDERGGRRAKR